MLNEKRIILMTKMASYEENEGKKNIPAGRYFRGDYIGWQVLKSIISASIAFVVVFAMYIFYNFDTFMADIYKMNLIEFVRDILVRYLWVVGAYAVISLVVYTIRYNRAVKSLRAYQLSLKRLADMYKQ